MCFFCPSDFNTFVLKILAVHALFHVGTSCSAQCFCLFRLTGFFVFFNSVAQSHWVLMTFFFLPPSSLVLLLRHFLLFEPLLCHQGATSLHFIPHPLVRISAALLWASIGEYGSLWVFGFAMSFVACSNTRRPLCGALQYSCKKKKQKNASCLPVRQV